MSFALFAACLFTTAAACWLCLMESVLRHPGFAQRMLMDVGIVLQSGLTLAVLKQRPGWPLRAVLAAGACAIMALGGNTILKTVTGTHFEGYAVVIGAALLTQGLLTLAMLAITASRGQPVGP